MRRLQRSGKKSGWAFFRKLIVICLLLMSWIDPLGAVEVDLYTGTATHRIAIDVPPGVAGLTPSLAMVYGGTQGNSWIGSGWTLEGISYIDAEGPQARGGGILSPQYRLVQGGRSDRLINAGVDPSGATHSQYWRTEQERFLRIWKNNGADGWVITGTDGAEYRFGFNHTGGTPTILGNWGNAWGRMYLTDITDRHGNQIRYQYDVHPAGSADSTSDAYIQLISYPGGSVKFTWQDRPDPYALGVPTPNLSTGRMNAGITVTRRLASIEIYFAGALLRRYDLRYTDLPPLATPLRHTPISQLASVTLVGADGTSALPATTFAYNMPVATPGMTPVTVTSSPPEPIGPDPNKADAVCSRLVDWNRDGLADLVVTDHPSNTYKLYLKKADASFQSPTVITTAAGTPGLCTFTDVYWILTSNFIGLGGGAIARQNGNETVVSASPVSQVALVDLDGDGMVDLLYNRGRGPLSNSTIEGARGPWSWYKNLGNHSFGPERAIDTPPPIGWMEDPAVYLTDINGDGLVDIAWIYQKSIVGNNIHYAVNWWLNVGNGRFTSPNPSISICALPPVHSSSPPPAPCSDMAVFTIPSSTGNVFQFADMNGDGRVDFVHVGRYQSAPGSFIGVPTVRYFPGGADQSRGENYFGPPIVMQNPTPTDYRLEANTIYIVDVNGDGLPDLLRGGDSSDSLGPLFQPNLSGTKIGGIVPLNGAPNITWNIAKHFSFADMNGDGFLDIVQGLPAIGGGTNYTYWTNSALGTTNHRLLKSVRTPLGGTESISYERKRDGNPINLIPIHTIKWVANEVTQDNGLPAGNDQGLSRRSYSYSGAQVAGWPWNEFRGFAQVTETDPPDHNNQRHRTVTRFHQDDARKGNVEVVEKLLDTQPPSLFTRTDYTYVTGAPVEGVIRVELSRQVVSTFDGDETSMRIQTDRADFDNYGQARIVTITGDLIATRVTTNDFAYNTTHYIVNKPSHTETRVDSDSGTSTKISEAWFDYDGLANGVAPTRGDLTKETRWLSGGSNPVVRHFYDTVGNRIGTIDAKNNTCASTTYTTKIDYDPIYQVFPITETNALCQQMTKTYWGVNAPISPSSFGVVVPGLQATTTDVNGVRIDSYWDALGRPIATLIPPDSNPATPTVAFSHLVTGIAPSRTVQTKRDGTGAFVIQVTYLDGFGRTVQAKASAEAVSTFSTVDTTYNSRGLVQTVSIPYLTATDAYTALNASQPKSTTLYDVMHRPIQVTNVDGTVRTNSYNDWIVTETDEKGFATIRIYDAMKRLIRVGEPGFGGFTSYTYETFDVAGNNIQRINDVAGNVTTTTFDTLGRKISQSDPDLGLWSYTYDANGNLLSQRDAKDQTVVFNYDKLNRVIFKSYPDGKQVVSRYDDPTANTFRKGRLWKIIDLSGATTLTYDQRGRQTKVEKSIGTGTPINVAVNPGFETGSATWPTNWYQLKGGTVTFAWDAITRRGGAKSVSMTNTTSWATIQGEYLSYTAGRSYTARAFIKTSNLSAPVAKVRLMCVDANSRQIGFVDSVTRGGTSDWGQHSVTLDIGKAPAGTVKLQVALMLDRAATGTVWFDDVRLEDDSTGTTMYSTKYTYDSLDRIVDITYPDNEVVRHAYNFQGQLDKLSSVTYGLDYVKNLNYNALGKVTAKTIGNGKTTTYHYFDDPAEGPTSFRLRNLSTPGLQNLTYAYDNAGNVSSITDISKVTTQVFGYDSLHRLTSAFSEATPAYDHVYVYKPVGNMTAGVGKTFTYPLGGIPFPGPFPRPPAPASRPHAPRGDGVWAYIYDANGNRTGATSEGVTRTYLWDFDNRLIKVVENGVTRADFVYDDAGQRVKKISGGNTTVYIGKHYECANGSCSKFFFANGERVAIRPVGSNEIYYYLPDHLGSTTLVTDRLGNPQRESAYFPYGQLRQNTGSIDVHHKFTGQEFDAETGLYYYGARYYDPELMHFISPDPVGIDIFYPQTLNRYAYALNNPLRYTDPTGLNVDQAGNLIEFDNSGNLVIIFGPKTSFSGMTFVQDAWYSNIDVLPSIAQATLNNAYNNPFNTTGTIGSVLFAFGGGSNIFTSGDMMRDFAIELNRQGIPAFGMFSGDDMIGAELARTIDRMRLGLSIDAVGHSLGGGNVVSMTMQAPGVQFRNVDTIDAVCASFCRKIPSNVETNYNFWQNEQWWFPHGGDNTALTRNSTTINNFNMPNTDHTTIVPPVLNFIRRQYGLIP